MLEFPVDLKLTCEMHERHLVYAKAPLLQKTIYCAQINTNRATFKNPEMIKFPGFLTCCRNMSHALKTQEHL